MKPLVPYLVVSLVFHVIFVIVLKLLPQKSDPPRKINVSVSDPFRRAKIIKTKQIVKSVDPNNKKPAKSKFLSEHDNSTEKEVVSPETGQNGTQPIDFFPTGAINAASREVRSGRAITGNPRNGPQSDLNTEAFKYVSFFERVTDNVAVFWDPLSLLQVNDPTSEKYMFKGRKTVLLVTLDEKGYIIQIVVANSSGVDFLDQEGIDAFRKCVQFPNPPTGMIKEGKIEFYFGFNVFINKSGFFTNW